MRNYRKNFHAKSDKKQKIFFCTPVSKFQKISTLNICDGGKQIYSKKQKILTRDTLRISVAVDRRCTVKKVSLKTSPPVYFHIIKIDIVDNNVSKPVKILISEKVTLAVMLYFVLCKSINKNVLEWFLPIISKNYPLRKPTNILSRNHSTFCFWLRRGRQMHNT